nr:hypothetical protein GCM10020241_45410 [Streptoalloteichus tenebrarius]
MTAAPVGQAGEVVVGRLVPQRLRRAPPLGDVLVHDEPEAAPVVLDGHRDVQLAVHRLPVGPHQHPLGYAVTAVVAGVDAGRRASALRPFLRVCELLGGHAAELVEVVAQEVAQRLVGVDQALVAVEQSDADGCDRHEVGEPLAGPLHPGLGGPLLGDVLGGADEDDAPVRVADRGPVAAEHPHHPVPPHDPVFAHHRAVVLAQLPPLLVHPVPVVGVDQGEVGLVGGALGGRHAVQLVQHVRPRGLVGGRVPLPGAQPRHALRVVEPPPLLPELALQRALLGDVLHGALQPRDLAVRPALRPGAAHVDLLAARAADLHLDGLAVRAAQELVAEGDDPRPVVGVDAGQQVGEVVAGAGVGVQLVERLAAAYDAGGDLVAPAPHAGDALGLQQAGAFGGQLGLGPPLVGDVPDVAGDADDAPVGVALGLGLAPDAAQFAVRSPHPVLDLDGRAAGLVVGPVGEDLLPVVGVDEGQDGLGAGHDRAGLQAEQLVVARRPDGLAGGRVELPRADPGHPLHLVEAALLVPQPGGGAGQVRDVDDRHDPAAVGQRPGHQPHGQGSPVLAD